MSHNFQSAGSARCDALLKGLPISSLRLHFVAWTPPAQSLHGNRLYRVVEPQNVSMILHNSSTSAELCHEILPTFEHLDLTERKA